ncbi:MAG: ABC-2 family transporter protein [archaeon]
MSLLKVFGRSLVLDIATDMAYKLNFVIKLIAVGLWDLIGPLLMLFIYQTTVGIPGWSFEQILLFVGTFNFVFGISRVFFIRLPGIVLYNLKEGLLDKFLVKPYNPLAYLTAIAVDPLGFADMFVGLVVIVYALVKLNIVIFSWNFLLYLFLMIFGIMFLYSLIVLVASFAIIFIKSWALFDIFFNVLAFGRYPLSIYGTGFTFALTFLFPIAIVANFPVEALLTGLSFLTILKVTLPVLAFFMLSVTFWHFAIKKYSSAGG